MAQPNKGERRQVISRVPESMVAQMQAYADARDLSMSETVADLVAIALECPLPSETLPRPKSRRQREVLPLGLTA